MRLSAGAQLKGPTEVLQHLHGNRSIVKRELKRRSCQAYDLQETYGTQIDEETSVKKAAQASIAQALYYTHT